MEQQIILDRAIQLEQKFSECYEKICQISNSEFLSDELKQLSREEIDHMNLLSSEKNYLKEAPDLLPESCFPICLLDSDIVL
jgi:rubrerythrin